jgi:hypothetical protein
MSEVLLDRAGRRRSPATMPEFHARRPPRNKGLRYPADPPKVEEIIAVMRAAGDRPHGRRLRGLMVILWRAGLRIQGPRARRSRSGSPPRRAACRRGKADAVDRFAKRLQIEGVSSPSVGKSVFPAGDPLGTGRRMASPRVAGSGVCRHIVACSTFERLSRSACDDALIDGRAVPRDG